MTFILDPALSINTIELVNWPLCKVLFKNEKQFAWFLLVPQQSGITELYQLSETDQIRLIKEISQLSTIIQNYFQPDKLNVAAIGNKVPQLHIHVVGRFKIDPLWPESIWQANYKQTDYPQTELKNLITELQQLVS